LPFSPDGNAPRKTGRINLRGTNLGAGGGWERQRSEGYFGLKKWPYERGKAWG